MCYNMNILRVKMQAAHPIGCAAWCIKEEGIGESPTAVHNDDSLLQSSASLRT